MVRRGAETKKLHFRFPRKTPHDKKTAAAVVDVACWLISTHKRGHFDGGEERSSLHIILSFSSLNFTAVYLFIESAFTSKSMGVGARSRNKHIQLVVLDVIINDCFPCKMDTLF